MKSHNEWVKESIAQQQNMNNKLGDRIWDEFLLPYHKHLLFQKVALPMFGSPKKKADDFGLSEKDKKLVNDIVDKCIKCSRMNHVVDLSVIFVFVRGNDSRDTSAPLFRVRSHKDDKLICKNKFIDHLGRVYNDWTHFKKTNKWDRCVLCVPYEGFYSYEKDIYFEVWDQSSQGKVLNVIDKASSFTTFATTASILGGTVACLFPPTALIGGVVVLGSSIIGAPSAAYGVGRNVEKIIDRAVHDQSISLLNSEARHCWLMTAASVLSIGGLASTSGLVIAARASTLPSSTIRILATTLNITSLPLSSVCMINSFLQSSLKYEISDLDIFNLSTSIFFLTHNLVSHQTVSDIIKKTQQEVKKNKQLSPEDQQKFDAQWKKFTENFEKEKNKKLHGKTEFKREIKNINNLEEFRENFQITSDDNLIINKVKISPKSFFQLNNGERNELVQLTKKLSNNQISIKKFNKCAKPIFTKYDIKLELDIESNVCLLKESIGVGEVQPIEVNRLANLLIECLLPGAEIIIIKLVTKISKKFGISDFDVLFIHIVKYLKKQVEVVMQKKPISANGQMLVETMTKEECGYAIAKEWDDNPAIEVILHESFNNYLLTQNKLNMESNSVENYDNHTNISEYNFQQNKYFPLDNKENYLTPDEYFCIATEIAGDIPSEIIWVQSGSTLECKLISKKYGNVTILFDHIENETKITATVMGVTLRKATRKECGYAIAKEWDNNPAIEVVLHEPFKNESFDNYLLTQNKSNMESNSEFNHMTTENYDNHTNISEYNFQQNKYFPLDNEENYLTPDEYFCIATEIAGDIPSEIIWAQSGSTLECMLISKKYGNVTILFDHIENETKITATAMGVTLRKTYTK